MDHRSREADRHLSLVLRPRPMRYTFGCFHGDTAALEPAAKADVFDSLPEHLQREAWSELRRQVEEREHATRSEVVA